MMANHMDICRECRGIFDGDEPCDECQFQAAKARIASLEAAIEAERWRAEKAESESETWMLRAASVIEIIQTLRPETTCGEIQQWVGLYRSDRDAALASLAAERERAERYRLAMEGLTAGGSEFYNDMDRCVEYIRAAMHNTPARILRAEAERDAVLAREESLNVQLQEVQADYGELDAKMFVEVERADKAELDRDVAEGRKSAVFREMKDRLATLEQSWNERGMLLAGALAKIKVAEEKASDIESDYDDLHEVVETLRADIDEHLPAYVLEDGTDEEANYRERIEYAGDEIKRHSTALAAARSDAVREFAEWCAENWTAIPQTVIARFLARKEPTDG